MTASLADIASLDVDLYAVRLVVREGVRNMPLNRAEQAVAAKLCKAKGLTESATADLLGVTNHLVGRMWRDKAPIDMESIDPGVMGNLIPRPMQFTRADQLAVNRAMLGHRDFCD